ncbi:serine hydrolase domain-containing protein [Mucilaginibacter dorajii]|uniref:Beta-lactamase-related domain-containing protein n=1 Tax=Mucilaginibacter dorajii TaxID=692994 RepID=A0ABP7QYQ5_9SPHI|nr:serine hydrolase [Mucilaginibacter dorajii]MCS3732372.1 CubicO group peptidase (beta-lactamase class C family) [Mucilaginibacter dorajii]
MMKKLFAVLLVVFTTATYAQNHAVNLKKAAQLLEAGKNVVLLNNALSIVPLTDIKSASIASVHFNYNQHAVFDSIANKYHVVAGFDADTVQYMKGFIELHDMLKFYNTVLIELSASTRFTPLLQSFIADLENGRTVVLVMAGNGKNLAQFDKVKSPVIWYKNDTNDGASVAAQLVFGGVAASNRLDNNYSGIFTKGAGFVTQKTRLGYSVPESVFVNSDLLENVDSILNAGIATHAAPAAVVLMAKDGQVIFSKAYGKHTYNGNDITKPDDIFDMASVTKVTATVPSVMRLYEKKLIALDDPISKYVAVTRNIPDKRDQQIKEALLHEAGYTPYIKFYEQLKPTDLSADSSAVYPTKVADHYYLRANYFNEVMWPVTLRSKVDTRGKFVYSDISMYMMKEVVEEVTHQKLNDYVLNEFYLPLGMQATGFLPRNRFNRSRIVPTTENDNWFRNMLVQGYVNDPGSAMAGGVEGHAGLFANANDMAIFYQMLLNQGSYGGQKYFDAATVNLFTSRQSKTSQRGLGYDRLNEKQLSETYPSQQAFGHSGYTGTYVWVDPKYNMVYICLTNRVYPDDGKTYGKSKVNIRAEVLDVFYKAVLKSAGQSFLK